ncbi:hypothetical protein E3E35_00500 [Thermococcus sp. GR7]|uniref:hypothetical protein n=1 Tax=unclassified Thermococcus TaxID=2627626 RepID=UPI001430D557|nr:MULTISPECIES: hypothetical protein [unclassified Thermococcus]NJE45909.1 hypothetical protein [Thermococcus sp. GR7]NJE78800.1 hypothetical protein [Thermococcus sp. GR4]NJF22104.1 hypothetical protein [Thermococcus sp. GR5]
MYKRQPFNERSAYDIINTIIGVMGIIISITGIYLHKYFLVFFLFLPLLLLTTPKNITFNAVPMTNGTNRKHSNLSLILLVIDSLLILQLLFAYILNPKLVLNPQIKFAYLVTISCILLFAILTHKSKRQSYFILLLIILWSITIRVVIYFEYPLYIGIDTWFHALMYKGIIWTGHVQPYVLYYSKFPMFHIYNAVTSMICHPLDKTLFVVTIMIPESILSITSVYLLVKKFLSSDNVGLIGAMLIGINMTHVLWSYWVIAMSLAVIYSMIFLLVYSKIFEVNDHREILLATIVSIAIIPTHPLYTVVLILFAVVMLIFNSFLQWTPSLSPEDAKRSRYPTLILIVILLIATWGYWVGTEYIVKTHIAASLRFLFRFQILMIKEVPTPISNFLKLSGVTTFVVISLYGTWVLLGSLSSKRIHNRDLRIRMLSLSLAGLALFGFAGTSVVLKLTAFFPDRWMPFIFGVLTIPVSVSMYLLLSRQNKLALITLSTLLITLVFTNFLYPGFYPEGSLQSINPNNYEHGQKIEAVYAVNFLHTNYQNMSFGSDLLLHPVFGYYQLQNTIVSYYWINWIKAPVDIELIRWDILNGEYFYHADNHFRGIVYLNADFREKLFSSYDRCNVYINNEVVAIYDSCGNTKQNTP